MKYLLLFLVLLPTLVFGQQYKPIYGGRYQKPNAYAGTSSTEVTSQVWVFENQWADIDGTAWYPLTVDSLVSDTDGSQIKYGYAWYGAPDGLGYNSSANRIEGYRLDGGLPQSTMRTAFHWWDLTLIPSTAQIISATFYTYPAVSNDYTTLNEITSLMASIDTFTTNFDNYLVGATQTSNPSVHSPSWNYVDLPNITDWEDDLDLKTRVNDYGWTSTVLRPGATVNGSGWWEIDMRQIVQKIVSDSLDESLVWWNVEEDLSWVAGNFYYSVGPVATTTLQPAMVVEWIDSQQYDPVRFVTFSDNHTNATGVTRMKDTLGDDIGDFLIHNGDMNLSSDMDTTQAGGMHAGVVAEFGATHPLIIGWGNHERDADGGASGIMTDFVVGHNRAVIADLGDFDANLARLGTLNNTIYNRYKSFSFDVGAAHIVIWNAIGTVNVTMDTNEREWLENDLRMSQQPLKLVFTHYPIWDVPDIDNGGNPTYGAVINAKETWDFFDAQGVHAVITGHRHVAAITKIGSMWLLNTPSTQDGQHQGFMTMDVASGGNMTVKLYRGYQVDTTWDLTQSQSVSITRAVATPDDGIIATSGRFVNTNSTEILGVGFEAIQGAGDVYLGDDPVYANCTELDQQTVTDWSDDWVEITVVISNVTAGLAYLFVRNDTGTRYGGWAVVAE